MSAPEAQSRCSAGRPPEVCCVGQPWEAPNLGLQIRNWGEPLYPEVIDAAVRHRLDPHALDRHVEAVHGWEPHDAGYAEAVELAAQCLLSGGCERP